ncbi:Putrescine importer PuuP [Marinomonas spartinae]|uniref:APC family permease n=1 Tax=Marinomonas spartinae TaxID=1792290 RepID=UPI000808AC52|nr:APC family permease [Marinomonas spartinae]SBS39602.1 Putrescine importer PuuP [Marinomonas spartinae]
MSEAVANTIIEGDASSSVDNTSQLKRTLGLKELVAYGLAFIAPVVPLTTFGFVWDVSGGLIALAFVVATICMYFTAKSYVTMAEQVPSAGSIYSYVRFGLGHFAGFVGGWLILLDYLLIPALVFLLMSFSCHILVPSIDRSTWIFILVGSSFLINWFGVQVTAKASLYSVIGQFIIVGGVIALAIIALQHGKGTGGVTLAPLYNSVGFSWHYVFAGASVCVLSFLGFDAISTLSEETSSKDPKQIGRAIMIVLAICGVVFTFTSLVIGNLMKGIEYSNPATAIFEILSIQVGPWASTALAWLLTIVVGFSNTLPMQSSVARVLFAMGRDRQLPFVLSKLHPKHKTPFVAMIVSTLFTLATALVMQDRLDTLTSLVNFGALSGFLLLHVAVFVRFGMKNPNRKWFAHVIVPFIGIAVVIGVLSGMNKDAMILGSIWLATGIIYALVNREKAKIEMAV